MVQPRSRTPLSPPLPAVLTFMQVLWSVAHRLDQTSKRMRAQLGITGPQRLVLRVVGLYHVHPSTLTGVLRRLQALRLLRRHADPRDRRRAVLRLTAGGRRANAVKSGTVEAAVAAAMFRCRDADVAAAGRVLAAVATQLESGTPPGATRRALPRKRGHHDDGV
jgi:MarR family transcriptional regulator, organic hydroperoxide resistance regulator